MRRLTLILSDLYLPAESVREVLPDTPSLPALEWLLRFADARPIEDWRRWLAQECGASEFAQVGPAAALAAQVGAKPRGAWIATPVSLEARLDHVRLRDRGLLRLLPEQREHLRADFARTFGPALRLHEAGDRGFLLEGGPAAAVTTIDPARLLDADIGPALPAAGAAGELRRLAAEIEMWLHSAPINDAREKSGQRRITSLWLWGGGTTADETPAWKGTADPFGRDPWLFALSGQSPPRDPPASFGDVAARSDAIVEFAPMSGGAEERLDSLETMWFAPVRTAISSGRLECFTLAANDQVFTVRARAGWRFWRRRRGWLAALAKA